MKLMSATAWQKSYKYLIRCLYVMRRIAVSSARIHAHGQAQFGAVALVVGVRPSVTPAFVEVEALLVEGLHDLLFDAAVLPKVRVPEVADGRQLAEVGEAESLDLLHQFLFF